MSNRERNNKLPQRKCDYCGRKFQPERKNGRFCCPTHAKAYHNDRSKTECLKDERECRHCHKNFKPNVWNQKTCDACLAKGLRGAPKPEKPEEADAPPVNKLGPESLLESHQKSIKNQLEKGASNLAIILDQITPVIQAIDPRSIPPVKGPDRRTQQKQEAFCMLLSDWHLHAKNKIYNIEVFWQTFHYLLNRIIRIKELMGGVVPFEKAVVFLAGDIPTGQGIFPNQSWKTSGNVMQQIFNDGIPALIQLVNTLLTIFPKVEIYTVPGNHGRTNKWDPEEVNFDTIMCEAAKLYYDGFGDDRVEWHIERDWYQVVDVYDHRFLLMHGDNMRMWSGIPFYGETNKGMRWQGSMPEDWDYMMVGHFHSFHRLDWNNFRIYGNGTLVAGDDFGLKALGMQSTPGQLLFGCHPDHGTTWEFPLELGTRIKKRRVTTFEVPRQLREAM
jgi:hypothetical protein